MSTPSDHRPTTGGKRRLVYALVAVALALLLATIVLTLLERGGAIDTERADDRVAYHAGRFLLTETTDAGDFYVLGDATMMTSRFAATKPPDTFRVFITGGSFALGEPYVSPRGTGVGFGGIADWLRALLEMRFPSRRFEVINAAADGQNSDRIRALVEELVATKPELIVVATGNNEGFVAATRFNQALHQWIVYRALKKTLMPDPPPDERLFFPPQDDNLRKIETRFRQNLEAIAAAAKKQNAPLALATMPIRLRGEVHNPQYFGDKVLREPEDDPALQRGKQALAQGDYEAALAHFAESENPAYAARYVGQCYEAMGRYDEARQFYKVYVQQNPLGRTRPSYNVFVRELAAKENLLLVDWERALEDLSPHGLPGNEIYFDNCHLQWEGYLALARVLAERIIASGLITVAPGEPLPAPSADEIIERYGWQALRTFELPEM